MDDVNDPDTIRALLLSMGFSEQQTEDAMRHHGTSLEGAVNYLSNHLDKPSTTSNHEEETRMVIVVRTDLKMGTGKIASQVAHAAVALFARMQERFPAVLLAWNANNTPKICLRVDSLEALETIEQTAAMQGLPVFSICDAGRTQIERGSKTCTAICATKTVLDDITGKLKLL